MKRTRGSLTVVAVVASVLLLSGCAGDTSEQNRTATALLHELDLGSVSTVLCENTHQGTGFMDTNGFQHMVGLDGSEHADEVVTRLTNAGYLIDEPNSTDTITWMNGPGESRAAVVAVSRDEYPTVPMLDGPDCKVPVDGLTELTIELPL